MYRIGSIAVFTAAFIAALAPIADSQLATALLREGDPLPAAGAGHAVSAIDNPAVNGVGGYSLRINTSDGVTTLSHAYGNPAGGPAALILSEQTVGNLVQTAWETFYGMADTGSIAYSPTCNDTLSGMTGLDTVFQDLVPLAVDGQPIPTLPGKKWRFASRPGITANGLAYWVGGIDDIVSGAQNGNGLFFTGGATCLAKTGDAIPGLPAPLDASAIDFDVRMSGSGTHWITMTDTTAATAMDAYLVIDGASVSTAAGLVGENQPVGALAGGLAGENWVSFDFLGINEAGRWMVTGDTAAATAVDEFVAWNGKIVYREGMSVDGQTLVGSIGHAHMNEAGDIAYQWEVTSPSGNLEALFLNGKLLVREGDLVDLDGDGLVDASSKLVNFTGISSLTVGADRKVYFTADIDTLGTTSTTDDTEGFFVIEDPCGTVARVGVGCAGSGGFIPSIAMTGCPSPGGTVDFSLTGGLGGSTALLLLGLDEGSTPLGGGCVLNISGLTPIMLSLPLGGAGAGNGSVAFQTVIPATLPPLTFTMQAFVADPASLIGGVGSNGLRATID